MANKTNKSLMLVSEQAAASRVSTTNKLKNNLILWYICSELRHTLLISKQMLLPTVTAGRPVPNMGGRATTAKYISIPFRFFQIPYQFINPPVWFTTNALQNNEPHRPPPRIHLNNVNTININCFQKSRQNTRHTSTSIPPPPIIPLQPSWHLHIFIVITLIADLPRQRQISIVCSLGRH